MAAEGVRFTDAYAGASVCGPSRSVLMTGLHVGHTPRRANGGGKYLYDSDVTIAEVLADAGYATGAFGKWGLGMDYTPGNPLNQGFDRFYGQLHQIHAHFYYPSWVWRNHSKVRIPENAGGARGRYVHDLVHMKGMNFIRNHRDQPFFLYLAYTIPHVELVVPDESEKPYRDKFPKITIEDPRDGYIGSDHAYATYAGMISRLDDDIGELRTLLEKYGLAENTIVVFTSDNGPQQGGPWDPLLKFFDGNGPLRGGKGWLYEGGIRVPLIAWGPGHVDGGRTSDLPVYFPDFLPTLADLANATPPERTDGISFAPTLLGEGEQKRHEFMYWASYHPWRGEKPRKQAVRMGKWKALQHKPGGDLRLYNLEKDIDESDDVSGSHPKVVEKVNNYLEGARTPRRDYPDSDPDNPGIEDYVGSLGGPAK